MPRAKKPKPEVWWVEYDRAAKRLSVRPWRLRVGAASLWWERFKDRAIQVAREEARADATPDRPIILRIRDRCGRIVAESSYHCDSKRRRG